MDLKETLLIYLKKFRGILRSIRTIDQHEHQAWQGWVLRRAGRGGQTCSQGVPEELDNKEGRGQLRLRGSDNWKFPSDHKWHDATQDEGLWVLLEEYCLQGRFGFHVSLVRDAFWLVKRSLLFAWSCLLDQFACKNHQLDPKVKWNPGTSRSYSNQLRLTEQKHRAGLDPAFVKVANWKMTWATIGPNDHCPLSFEGTRRLFGNLFKSPSLTIWSSTFSY